MVAFERADAASFGERGLGLFRLLYPTFLLGVQRCISQNGQTTLPTDGKDLLLQPALWFDFEGQIVHVTSAARLLLAADPDRERLGYEARDLALMMVARIERSGWAELESPVRMVRTEAGPYWLCGAVSHTVSRSQETVIVELIPPAGERMTKAELQQSYGLTRREVDVAYLLAERKTNAEIAEELYISPHTARHHTERVLEKMGISSREAVASLIQAPTSQGYSSRAGEHSV